MRFIFRSPFHPRVKLSREPCLLHTNLPPGPKLRGEHCENSSSGEQPNVVTAALGCPARRSPRHYCCGMIDNIDNKDKLPKPPASVLAGTAEGAVSTFISSADS